MVFFDYLFSFSKCILVSRRQFGFVCFSNDNNNDNDNNYNIDNDRN